MVITDNRSILLVVDDADDIYLFKESFIEINPEKEFIVYRDGREVLDALHRAKRLPTIVLMDLYIPRRDGFEVLSEIKRTESLKSLHVLLYSGTSYEQLVHLAYDNGADLFIPKPVTIQEMKKLVNYLNNVDLTVFERPNLEDFVFTYDD